MFEEKDIFEVRSSDENFKTWSERPFVDDSIRDLIAAADILLVPTTNFREAGPNFPPGTEELLAYLKSNIGAEFNIDICISDELFSTLSLNSDYKRLGKFLVKKAALPIFITVFSGYILFKITNVEDVKPRINIVNNITVNNIINNNAIPSPKDHSKKNPHKYHNPPKVTFTITVVDTNGKSVDFHYEGSPKEINKVTDELKKTFLDGN